MDTQQYTYYAFISYQRKDEKWAKWLQRKLENYKLPVANAKDTSDKKSKYIRPVFRDKTDLTAGPLPDALKEALNQSRYLIVICSPNAVQSPWVNDEINTFVNADRTKYIIPFIVDGEPYSDDKAKECFPDALKAIPKEQEPLGVNICEGGKQRAFIRTVAYMLGVKFDELWNRYERHRRKIRNIAIACLAFLAVIALGIYDYTRTKVEYYADWVDCNGVAQGVIPLTDEQYSHRYASYKFEYTRVPFGEKGFYSWRLNKVSLVNSKGVISNYIPDSHPFFYPIQEYKYTDGYVTEIINRDTYNRVVMRYTIKDDYDHKVACLVDMEGKEKHQGSAYLSGSTTAFLSDANSNSAMSKIKRFHYTRNEKGYITKVTYHANDADELDESAIGDNNNIYGKIFELDSLGRVTKVLYINHEGYPMTDKYGVRSIRYNNAAFEGNDTVEYLGSDGKLAYNEHRFARLISKLDKYGNPIEQWNEGNDGMPCYQYENIYRQVISYDDNGCWVEIKYYDFDGNLSYCSDNFAIQRVKYDAKGRYIEVSHYDINDKPCYIKGNYSIARAKYNSNDCIVEVSSFNVNDKPCIEQNYGVHKHCYKYDDYKYLIEESLYDENDELTISPIYHFAKQELTYDDYHQMISVKNYDNNNNPCLYKDYTHKKQWTYDNRGNIIRIDCFDIDGNPCICKEGYATIIYKFDSFGNITEEKYLGKNKKPIYINMCASIKYEYTKNGLLSEERFYDSDDSLCLNVDWWAIAKYEYDKNGNCTKISYFNSDSIPCYTRNNIFSIVERIYDNNNIVEERFYDKDGTLFMNAENYAIGRYIYNDKRQVISHKYFDNYDKPSTTTNLIHSIASIYDNRGQLLSQEYFDKYGKRCNNKNGYSKETKVYDEYGRISEASYFDALDKPIESNRLAFKTTYAYDHYGRIVSEQHLNANGKLTWQQSQHNEGIKECWIEYEYDKFGNVTKTTYKDPIGKATDFAGWATCLKQYDELLREIEIRYYDSLNQPIGGQFKYPIEKYAYDDNYQRLSLFYNDSSLVASVHTYFDKGHMTKLSFTDKDGNPILKYIQGICSVPCATRISEFDEKGNNVKVVFLDQKGNLLNTEAGYAYMIMDYDEKGRYIESNCYDTNNKLSNGKVSGASTEINKYDIYGNLSEQSYYDKNGHLANTPWTWSRRLQTFNEKGQALSDTYYMPDGSVNTYQRSENGGFESKSDLDVVLPEKDRQIIILQVEGYGQMFESGFRGVYVILEFNEWNMTQDLESFTLTLMGSKGKKKHLVLLPVGNKLGEEEVIEHTFSEDALSARIMDSITPDGENREITLKKYEKWKNSKKD